jgi:hypothetical protein
MTGRAGSPLERTTVVRYDPACTDDERRALLFAGELLVHPPTSATRALAAAGRALVEERFAPLDPRTAQFDLADPELGRAIADLTAAAARHPGLAVAVDAVLIAAGCDPERTYVHGPLLRIVTHGGYLAPWGVGTTYHPHRDTWISASASQVNWWLPLYPVGVDSCLAIYPDYWDRPVRNGSHGYDYPLWNDAATSGATRREAAIGLRGQPRAEEPIDPGGQLRLVCPAAGLLTFSAAHLHATVPNTSRATRFSVEFRSVHRDDVAGGRAAPDPDSAATGTWLRDFRRLADHASFPLSPGGPS